MRQKACEPVDLGRQDISMKIIFIRHGEPDYSLLEEAGYTGFRLDLAPLSAAGRRMATEAAANPLLEQAEILISSSVTRALETASYLIRNRQLPLFVEPFLHEWQVYESGTEKFEQARKLFFENNGSWSIASHDFHSNFLIAILLLGSLSVFLRFLEKPKEDKGNHS